MGTVWFSCMERKLLDFPQQRAKPLLGGCLANCFNRNTLKWWGELWEKSSVNNTVPRHLSLTLYLHDSTTQPSETSVWLLPTLRAPSLAGSRSPERDGGQNICRREIFLLLTHFAPRREPWAVSQERQGKRLRRTAAVPRPRGSCGALPTRWQAAMPFAFFQPAFNWK